MKPFSGRMFNSMRDAVEPDIDDFIIVAERAGALDSSADQTRIF